MSVLKPVRAEILATKFIPNVAPELAKNLKLRPEQSISMFTCTIDDVVIQLLTRQRKSCRRSSIRSFFLRRRQPCIGPLSGEFIGILAGPNPAEAGPVLQQLQLMKEDACFYTADEKGELAFYAIPSLAAVLTYLKRPVAEGTPLAYLIAPPWNQHTE